MPPEDNPATPATGAVDADTEISFIEPPAPDEVEIPERKAHYQLPTRFGAVPVDEAPLGWEVETRRRETKVTKFQHAYPTIRLLFQEVQRVELGTAATFRPRTSKTLCSQVEDLELERSQRHNGFEVLRFWIGFSRCRVGSNSMIPET